jgi:hypothetical protein
MCRRRPRLEEGCSAIDDSDDDDDVSLTLWHSNLAVK